MRPIHSSKSFPALSACLAGLPLLLPAMLSGCATSQPDVMHYESRRLPFQAVDGGRQYDHFFVSTRKLLPDEVEADYDDRALGAEPRFGVYSSRLDDGFEAVGNKPEEWTGTAITGIDEMDAAAFFASLKGAVDASPGRSLLIVLFGYKESFETAGLKTAAFAYRVDINTPVLFFDWPGNQSVTPRGYRRAIESARISAPPLGDLIARIDREIAPDNLWITGNSMGAQVICDAFSHMMEDPELADPDKEIRHVILAAPDVDRAEFDDRFSHELDALSERLAVFVSSDDRALLLSQWLNRAARLGRRGPGDPGQLEELEDLLALKARGADSISLIDFTRVNRASHSHNYYIESSEYFDEFYQRLMGTFPYPSRRRHAVRDENDTLYWVLFSDRDLGQAENAEQP